MMSNHALFASAEAIPLGSGIPHASRVLYVPRP